MAVKVKALTDLKVVKRAIAEQARQRVSQASEQVKAVKQAASDKDLFVRAAGAVKPLPDKRKVLHKAEQKMPLAMQYQRDEKAVLVEAISDEFDVGTLLDADDLLAPDKIALQMQVSEQIANTRTLLSSEFGYFFYRTSKAQFHPTPLWTDLSPEEWLLRKMGQNDHMQPATWLVRELIRGRQTWPLTLGHWHQAS